MTTSIGLRELRQNASEVIRRVEDGAEVDVPVNGRVAARLSPVRSGSFRDPAVLSRVFREGRRVDSGSWARDIATMPDGLRDPWRLGDDEP